MLLPETASSWGAILTQRRIHSGETAVSVAIEQIGSLNPLLPEGTRLLADRWYATGSFVQAVSRLGRGALLRLKRNRKRYRPAPAKQPGTRGPACKDGELFQGSRQQTWSAPDEERQHEDEAGKWITVQAWHRLHFRQAREVEMTVFRVLRAGAKGTKHDLQECWFIWIGPVPLALCEVVLTYKHRFSHEHTYRFLKQDLLWTKVRVRTPEQFERWSLLVARLGSNWCWRAPRDKSCIVPGNGDGMS
jgi:hypothetical protein